MTRENIFIPNNKTLGGLRKSYDAWEFRPSEMNGVRGEALLCMLCYVTLPFRYHFFYAKFHSDIQELREVNIVSIVYSFVFISAFDEREADAILSDLQDTLDQNCCFHL